MFVAAFSFSFFCSKRWCFTFIQITKLTCSRTSGRVGDCKQQPMAATVGLWVGVLVMVVGEGPTSPSSETAAVWFLAAAADGTPQWTTDNHPKQPIMLTSPQLPIPLRLHRSHKYHVDELQSPEPSGGAQTTVHRTAANLLSCARLNPEAGEAARCCPNQARC